MSLLSFFFLELAEEGHCFLFSSSFFLGSMLCAHGRSVQKEEEGEKETEKRNAKRRIHSIKINEKVHNCEKLKDCVNLDSFPKAINMTNGAKNIFFRNYILNECRKNFYKARNRFVENIF